MLSSFSDDERKKGTKGYINRCGFFRGSADGHAAHFSVEKRKMRQEWPGLRRLHCPLRHRLSLSRREGSHGYLSKEKKSGTSFNLGESLNPGLSQSF